MSDLYPLKFIPIFKEKIWGGQKINTVLQKDYGSLENCGESWEISGVAGNISIVSNGVLKGEPLDKLVSTYKSQILGDGIYSRFGDEFPLLIKFIDAAEDLSIQVHPDDELAKERHNGFGKTEMWYVLQADLESTLISGFNTPTNREEYLDYFNSGNILKILNKEFVFKNDVFYLPAGRVHTIGKGILLAEIQQTSDITYRIYDFDREDKDGNKRELHVNEALDAIDFNAYDDYKTRFEERINDTSPILKTPFFTTNKLKLDKEYKLDRSQLDCFKIYIGVGGSGKIAGEPISLGEALLVPANMKAFEIEPDDTLELLETYIEL